MIDEGDQLEALEEGPKPEEEPKAEEAPPAPPEPDAVIVVRHTDATTGVPVWVAAEIRGNVTVDQIATGLRMAAKRADDDLFGPSKR